MEFWNFCNFHFLETIIHVKTPSRKRFQLIKIFEFLFPKKGKQGDKKNGLTNFRRDSA